MIAPATMEQNDIRHQAVQESYRDVERMIADLVRRHTNCPNCDYEERIGAANEAYCRAYAAYDPRRGAFTTLVWHSVRNKLKNQCRACCRHPQVGYNVNSHIDRMEDKKSIGLTAILADLSDDARVVVEMVLEAPGELKSLLKRNKSGQDKRYALSIHLQKLGWTMARVVESFHEIRRAL